jgi:hypothetical protein
MPGTTKELRWDKVSNNQSPVVIKPGTTEEPRWDKTRISKNLT